MNDEFDEDFARLRAKDWAAFVAAGVIWLALATVIILALAGCASSGPPKPDYVAGMQTERLPLDTPFERCVATVGKQFYYTSDRIRAADWCAAHDNGGITVPVAVRR
jgi:hypothetical protein